MRYQCKAPTDVVGPSDSRDSRDKAICRLVQSTARKVYDELGWGWREDVYREALARDLRAGGLQLSCEVAMPVVYKGSPLSHVSVRWDMVVEDCVVVELKATKGPLALRALRQCKRYAGSRYHCLAINFPDREGEPIEAALALRATERKTSPACAGWAWKSGNFTCASGR